MWRQTTTHFKNFQLKKKNNRAVHLYSTNCIMHFNDLKVANDGVAHGTTKKQVYQVATDDQTYNIVRIMQK